MKKLLFIVNTHAGKKKSSAPLFDAIARFSQAGYLLHVVVTESIGDARKAAETLGKDFDMVVCSGGDGTLNETISGLMTMDPRPDIGYLPNGSTNDFASSLHLSSNPSVAAGAIVSGRPHTLDIGSHNNRYFAYVASFGAFTKTSYSASQAAKNALGHLAYILEGITDLDTLRPYCCKVVADGEVFDGDFIFGAVCNSTSLGGLVKLDPSKVNMNDGQFELLLLKCPKNLLELNSLIVSMTKMEYNAPGIIFRHVSSVTLTTSEDIPWSLDGEYAPSQPVVEIRNHHKAIRIVS